MNFCLHSHDGRSLDRLIKQVESAEANCEREVRVQEPASTEPTQIEVAVNAAPGEDKRQLPQLDDHSENSNASPEEICTKAYPCGEETCESCDWDRREADYARTSVMES